VQISANEPDPDRTTNVKNKDEYPFTFISVATYTATFGLGSKLGVGQLVTLILEINPVWLLDFGQLFTAGFQNAQGFLEQ
jgi:hypothetical protein